MDNPGEPARPELPFARPLPPDRLPARLELELPDGYRTSVFRHSPPAGASRLPVLYLHGIQSHPGWFVHSADALAQAGHPVYQVTRRGSGDNARDRGHAASPRQLLDDVDSACRFVLADAGAQRLHALGVSWGGKLLAAWAASGRAMDHVQSLVLIAPGIVPRVDVPAGVKLRIATALLANPRRLFDIPLSDPALLTDNPQMQEFIRRDECSLRQATARFLYVSRLLDRQLTRAHGGAIAVPTTLILAERDRIIDSTATAQAVQRLTSNACRVHTLAGAHTLEFEPDPASLTQFLGSVLRENE